MLKITFGTNLPKNFIEHKGNRRYRISGDETHLCLLVRSSLSALEKSGHTIKDMDCIIGASAVGLQPIPCTAALVHEQIASESNIPAFDVNTTCTSFLVALDIASAYIKSGRYKRALIVAGDVPSIALNPNETHSAELFSDCGVSAVVENGAEFEITYAKQLTYSKGAHLTEIVGGGTNLPSYQFSEEIKSKYQFAMKGKKAILTSIEALTAMIENIGNEAGMKISDFDLLIPHQASQSLGLVMRKIGVPTDKYIDIVTDYGNMVSASVPFAWNYALRNGRIKKGDKVLLIGTAAGLTLNAMILNYQGV
jgi:3-oxoacyl-[acyl-carrier-protein] synthase-3